MYISLYIYTYPYLGSLVSIVGSLVGIVGSLVSIVGSFLPLPRVLVSRPSISSFVSSPVGPGGGPRIGLEMKLARHTVSAKGSLDVARLPAQRVSRFSARQVWRDAASRQDGGGDRLKQRR